MPVEGVVELSEPSPGTHRDGTFCDGDQVHRRDVDDYTVRRRAASETVPPLRTAVRRPKRLASSPAVRTSRLRIWSYLHHAPSRVTARDQRGDRNASTD